MGASNRHGGFKLSRRLKVLFMGQRGRHDVFRNYFGSKKASTDGGAPAASAAPAAPAPEAK